MSDAALKYEVAGADGWPMLAARQTRPALVAIVGLLTLLAIGVQASPTAAAGPGLTTHSASVTIAGPPGTLGSVTVRCPRGQRVVSGGYDGDLSFHPNGSGTVLLAYTSRRVGRRAWKVAAYSIGIGEPLTLTATAYCAAGIGALRTETRRASVIGGVNDPRVGSVSAHCPRQSFALSGGFQYSVNGRATVAPDTPPVAFIFGSRSVRRSWAVSVARLAAGRSSMTAFAYCASTRPAARHRFGILRRSGSVPRVQRFGSRPCPRGTFASSGGFTARFPMGSPGLQGSFALGSGLQGRTRWATSSVPLDSAGTVNSVVYCLRNDLLSSGGPR